MVLQNYPNGTGELLGGPLTLARPLLMSGNIWYVHHDGTSSSGLNREDPTNTLAQAITNAAAGDWIVLMPGHSEVIAVNTTLPARCRLVGSGSSNGEPTSELRFTGDGYFTLPQQAQIHWVKFPARSSSGANPRFIQSSSQARFVGCVFEMGASDTQPCISLRSTQTTIQSCTFRSSSIGSQIAPVSALANQTASGPLWIQDCVFDGGEVGFSSPAINLTTVAVDDFSIFSTTLQNGADLSLHASSTGHLAVTATGGSRISW